MLLNCGAGEDSLRVPRTASSSSHSILKEISPEYSLEELMLKLQCFGHLMQRADSLEKTLILRKIEGRRRGWQIMRWLDGITDNQFSSVQSLSRVQLFATPWTAALSFTVSQNLLKLMSIESVMPSNHLILCFPLLPSISLSMRVFSNELALHIRCPKYWSFSISSSNEYSGLISVRIDWLDLLAVQGTLKSLLQHQACTFPLFRGLTMITSKRFLIRSSPPPNAQLFSYDL